MKALRWDGPRTVSVADVPDPTLIDEDSAILEVSSSGICGSDLHTYSGYEFAPDPGFILGHEAVGRVLEVGSAVRTIEKGHRVLVPASAGCLTCPSCSAGWTMGCLDGHGTTYGIGIGHSGLQAQYAAITGADRNLTRISDAISDDAAVVLTDNLPTGWNAVQQAEVRPGSVVAVVGLGPVGLSAVMSAVACGASRVLAIDPLPDRRAAAEELGGEGVFADDIVEAVRDLTDGHNADCVVEAVGAAPTITTSIGLAAVGGHLAIAGVPPLTMEWPIMHVFALQLTVRQGACSVQQQLPPLLRLVEVGKMRPEALVSHHFPLTEGPLGYTTFASREPGTRKIVFNVEQ